MVIKLNFIAGGEVMWIRIDGRVISLKGKMSNYSWMDMRDLTEKEKEKVGKKHGKEWFKEYSDALDLREKMTEDQIAKDLTKDMQKSGWRLARRT